MTYILIFLCGLVGGSLLNICIKRIPQGERLITRFSHCHNCKTELRLLDLIPVISWILLRGKCRYCDKHIHFEYPLIELVNGLAWVLIIFYLGLSLQGIVGAFVFSLSLVIFLIDLKHYIIPNGLVITFFLTGVIHNLYIQDINLLNSLIGMGVGFSIPFLLAIVSRGGMGGGDIKLIAAMGFWLGFPQILSMLFIAAVLGSLVGLILILIKQKRRKDPIPFGPFLISGFLLMYFFALT